MMFIEVSLALLILSLDIMCWKKMITIDPACDIH